MMPLVVFAQEQIHVVRKGDTLYSLSKRYGLSVQEIQKLNSLNSSALSIGQKLKVGKKKAEPKPPVVTQPAPKPNVTPSPTAKPGTTPVSPNPTPSEDTEEEAQTPSPQQRASLPPSYFYEIKRGDNLYRVALNHQIKLADMLVWNGFENAEVPIYPGKRIIIKDPFTNSSESSVASNAPLPVNNPVLSAAAQPDTVVIEKVYIVQPKDTLFRIAKANSMSVDDLKRLNSLSSNEIQVGQKIYLAGTPRATGTVSTSPNITEDDIMKKDKIRTDLSSPVEGKVLSEYGLRNGRPHKGIDLGAKTGTPIYAVLDGTVVYSGVQGSYGNVVVLEHPDFVMTVYAHNEKNMVSVGDVVTKGQQIATVGSTGNASGSHLHFEYRIKGKAINPRKVLP